MSPVEASYIPYNDGSSLKSDLAITSICKSRQVIICYQLISLTLVTMSPKLEKWVRIRDTVDYQDKGERP